MRVADIGKVGPVIRQIGPKLALTLELGLLHVSPRREPLGLLHDFLRVREHEQAEAQVGGGGTELGEQVGDGAGGEVGR